jgi:peptidoglycan/xylan/chitin deacetylase (PgdA/CDA1 family)
MSQINTGLFPRFLQLLIFLVTVINCFGQEPEALQNDKFLNDLEKNKSYTQLRKKIISGFSTCHAGKWGEFVKGEYTALGIQKKALALTFDACGGRNGCGYDKELIDYLRREKVPATLFISGKWIDAEYPVFEELCRDTLFEIENHGLNHRPCSFEGEKVYGIKGTSGVGEAFDEVEANAYKIEAISGHRPVFYRSATAYTDEASVSMAGQLGIKIVSYQVLSGDAVAGTPEKVIEKNVLKKVKPGSIVIMHFNHPEWNTFEALRELVPELRKEGYSFVRLKDSKLIPVK